MSRPRASDTRGIKYRDRPSDDGKQGAKDDRPDAPDAASSLGNFANDDLQANKAIAGQAPRPSQKRSRRSGH